MKRFVAVLLILLFSCCFYSAYAEDDKETESFESDGYTYILNPEGGATITRGINGSFVVIPASLDGYPVTKIGDKAFSGRYSLTDITIPVSVTSIGSEAFYLCTSLTDIVIPVSVTNIGSEAFYGCTSLTGITLPVSVTSIGEWAFGGCSSLTDIVIPDSVTSIGKGAFDGCSSLTDIVIPDGVTSIGKGAFWGCYSLTMVCADNSAAHAYAVKNRIPYIFISDTSWLN